MQQQNRVVLTPVTPREGVDQLSQRYSWRKRAAPRRFGEGIISVYKRVLITAVKKEYKIILLDLYIGV